MHRFIIILIGVIVSVHTQVNKRKCFDNLNFAINCCRYNTTVENEASMLECFHYARDRPSCAFETCYGEKRGFVLSNGTVDMTLLTNTVEKDYQNYTDVVKILKEKCVTYDLDSYGPPDVCYLKKLVKCLQIHATLNCPQWEESEHCNKVKRTIEECENILS